MGGGEGRWQVAPACYLPGRLAGPLPAWPACCLPNTQWARRSRQGNNTSSRTHTYTRSAEASLRVADVHCLCTAVHVIQSRSFAFSFYLMASPRQAGMLRNRKRKQRSNNKEEKLNYMNCCTQNL